MPNPSGSEAAVRLRGACKAYGGGKDVTLVLDHLDMTVPKGSIFGLLGASGCGKTTLLGCICGRLSLDAGDIRVLGGQPGSKDSGVPGPRVGYMPQEVALVDEFSVQGAIYYFGWLFGMSSRQIAERYLFLSSMLQLPPGGQLIKDLSGGQRRRVSFAVALVHTPELLILDEPTVGLDAVLRQSIWDHLVEMSRDRNTTIIITTHYIDEARQAHKIGMMREGTLLAETTPERLISHFSATTLEEVFLILSRKQGDGETLSQETCDLHDVDDGQVVEDGEDGNASILPKNDDGVDGDVPCQQRSSKLCPQFVRSPISRLKAMLYKNFLRTFRNAGGLFFLFFFPAIETVFFFVAIGGDPYSLPIGVVNDEMGDCTRYNATALGNLSRVQMDGEDFRSCHYYGLSCLYMARLNDSTTVNVYYESLGMALADTRKGRNQGVIHFPVNFSALLEQRELDGRDADNDTLDASELSVWLDMSNSQIGLTMEKHLRNTYTDFARHIARGCNISVQHSKIPMQFNKPVYGVENPRFVMFMAPAMIISMVFFFSVALTTTAVIVERCEGIWDRNIVAGVTSGEMLCSHLITQAVSMVVQMAEMLVIGFFVFDMQCVGSVPAMITLVFLQSLAGVAFGLLISVCCKSLTTANNLALGSFYPHVLMGGMMWPLEGMPAVLRHFSYVLPGTWAITALRNVMDRGWGWTHPQVWPGFLVSSAWIAGVFALSGFIMKRQNI